ncbi:MAG: acyclic terpene utilization AtuA family protein [Beijerinckiaceae bacterium]
MKQVRLGAGSGFSGDRIEPAADLARDGALDYLVFECLAERTIALAQLARLADPEKGYDPLLEARFRAVLPLCAARKVRIVTNMGAANPQAAAAVVAKIAGELGLRGLRIATVTGDDVLEQIRASDCRLQETGASVGSMGNSIVSANAYLGAAPIAEALEAGADIVITGRVSDPALFLGPLIHEFGWRADDWEKLGRGVLAGHLLECAGQITGGYFADPGFKDVGDLARLGFPIGIVDADGGVTITKLEGSGGVVSAQTCKEQLLYEIDDPARYMQPDVVADFSQVTVEEAGRDVVRIAGAGGGAAPETLKVSVGYRDGYVGEGQISYAGPGALGRGRLAGEIVRERLALIGARIEELRVDLIGVDSLHGRASPQPAAEPYEVRLRVAGRAESADQASLVGAEVESLYTNGPAGGGGVTKSVKPVIAIGSAYLPRADVKASVQMSVVP